jgi:rhodanese-related sulfurtransferase
MNQIILFVLIFTISVSGQMNPEFEEYLNDLKDKFEVANILSDSLALDQYLILDTREREEYEVSHIKDAVWIGYDDFEISQLDSIQRETEIIVYCSVGYRSSKIALELYDNGFTSVYNLYGGIFKWANDGRTLISNNESTRNLHGYNSYWARFITNPKIIKTY